MRSWVPVVAAAAAGFATSIAAAGQQIDTRSFIFAPVGGSYTAGIFGNDPIIGKQAIETRITFNVRVNAGSDAANLVADVLLPIIPDAGNTNVINISGADLGWSGSGDFSYTLTTTIHNGEFRAGLFGGETTGVQGSLLAGTGIEVDYIVPAPGVVAAAAPAMLLALRRRRAG